MHYHEHSPVKVVRESKATGSLHPLARSSFSKELELCAHSLAGTVYLLSTRWEHCFLRIGLTQPLPTTPLCDSFRIYLLCVRAHVCACVPVCGVHTHTHMCYSTHAHGCERTIFRIISSLLLPCGFRESNPANSFTH